MASQLIMNAPKLTISLFGIPKVQWENQTLVLPRRQTRVLLYVLAASSERVTRDSLLFLLWPDTADQDARRTFSRLLTHLRRLLPDPNVLIAQSEQVGFVPQAIYCDAREFEIFWRSWETSRQISTLKKAVQLYRQPFLQGVSLESSLEFEAWVFQKRQEYERMYLDGLRSLVDVEQAAGHYAESIHYAQRYLAVDNLAEDIHRRLIALYAQTGDRSAALRQYEACLVVLERELGIDPMPETYQVYKAVLEGGLLPHSGPPAHPAQPVVANLQLPLVDRIGASAWLESCSQAARSGRGNIVFVTGEPGIGKTLLVKTFANRVRGQALVISGQSYATGQTVPYLPILNALRQALSSDIDLSGIEDRWLGIAASVLPELAEMYPNLPDPPCPESGNAQRLMYEALSRVLTGLSNSAQPVILFLDDLDRADDETICWLAYLSSRLAEDPACYLLIIGAISTYERKELQRLRFDLEKLGVFSEIVLEGISDTAIMELLENLCGSFPELPHCAHELRERTQGNPFFILEILRTLHESGMPHSKWSEQIDLLLPDSVSQSIQQRLARLAPVSRHVLESGAVLAPVFQERILAWMCEYPENQIADALDELTGCHLLVEQEGSCHFFHPLIRETAYQRLSFSRRRLLHRRAAQVLLSHCPGQTGMAAWHYEQAGELSTAALHFIKAGKEAVQSFAHTRAMAHFEHALNLLHSEPEAPESADADSLRRLRWEAMHGLAWTTRLAGDMPAYIETIHAMTDLAKGWGDQIALAERCWHEAAMQNWYCRYQQAREAAEAGLREGVHGVDRAMCLRELGLAARELGDFTTAQMALEEALDIFTSLNDDALQVHTLGHLSTLYLYHGDVQQARAYAQQALDFCERAGYQDGRRLPLGDLGAAALASGDLSSAWSLLEESLSIARQIADHSQEIFCLGYLGWVRLAARALEEARERFKEALQLARSVNYAAGQCWLLSGLSMVSTLQGDHQSAECFKQEARRLSEVNRLSFGSQVIEREVLIHSCL